VKLNGKFLPNVDKCTYFGMIIDSQLTWKPHIEYVTAKLLKFSIFTNSAVN